MQHIYTPYTYLFMWTLLNKKYYGVRYSRNGKPADLLKTYFSSSRVVKRFIQQHGLPDVCQVRRVFNTAHQAKEWEHKVLRRLKVHQRDDWLNISVGSGYVSPKGEKHALYGTHLSSETKNKISKSLTGRNLSESHKQKISASHKGKKRPVRTKEHMNKIATALKSRTGSKNSNYGKRWDDTKRAAASERAKKRDKHPSFKKIIFNGVEYESIKDAIIGNFPDDWSYNRCWYNIRKSCIFV